MAKRAPGFEVLLSRGAERDLEDIVDYIAGADGAARAHLVLDRLMAVVDSLRRFPDRGSHPKELLALGIKEYRQATFKDYRVLYRVIDRRVVVYLVVDGRRDMQAVLARRLLED